jgi:hypothetical protein
MNEPTRHSVMLESGQTSQQGTTAQESISDPNHSSVRIVFAMSTVPGLLIIMKELVDSTKIRPLRNTANLCHAGFCNVRAAIRLPTFNDSY